MTRLTATSPTVANGSGEFVVTTSGGQASRYAPGAAESGLLADGLDELYGVAIGPDGSCLFAASGAGRVVRLTGSTAETVVDGLQRPQGILVADGLLYSGDRHTIASGLPVGPPPGVEPKPLKGMPPFSGPRGPSACITAGPDGSLYVSADGDGSILALRRVDGWPTSEKRRRVDA